MVSCRGTLAPKRNILATDPLKANPYKTRMHAHMLKMSPDMHPSRVLTAPMDPSCCGRLPTSPCNPSLCAPFGPPWWLMLLLVFLALRGRNGGASHTPFISVRACRLGPKAVTSRIRGGHANSLNTAPTYGRAGGALRAPHKKQNAAHNTMTCERMSTQTHETYTFGARFSRNTSKPPDKRQRQVDERLFKRVWSDRLSEMGLARPYTWGSSWSMHV